MSVPFYGPSQRVEISSTYLHNNDAGETSSLISLYPCIDPKDNVAEAGQVVLLQSTVKEEESCHYEKLEVMPDASGYRVNFNPKSLGDKLDTFLLSEIKRYNVGVNQVEKGVGVAHTASGYGWDISFTPGQPANILHTGSEPINRFDYVAVRFPTEKDVRHQAEVWQQVRNARPSLSKFATYPVRENWELMRYSRFHHDVDAYRCHLEIANMNSGGWNSSVKYQQLPALFNLMGKVLNACEKDDAILKSEFMRCCNDTMTDFDDSPLITTEKGFLATLQIAKAAIDFATSLRPPIILAQCLDFECAQPHLKGHAQCGDMMRCILT